MCASRSIRFIAVIVGMLSATAHGLTYTLRPISASGAHTIVGNEIRMTGGGQRVRLEIRIAAWAPDEIKTWQTTINSAGYSSGINGPLVPAFVACTTNAQCAAAFGDNDSFCALFCNGGANDGFPCQNVGGCPGGISCDPERCEAGFIDDDRADWVFVGISAVPAVNTFSLDYAFGATTISSSNAIDPGGGQQRYGGTLLLDVPALASGTFTVNFKPGIDDTFFTNQDGFTFTTTNVPALITVLCSNPGQCNDGNFCTSDTCNGLGQCINTPNFNPALFCCNPANGTTLDLSDNNPCTADTCSGTGQPIHTPTPGAACGNPNNTQCDNPDICVVILNVASCSANPETAGFACGNSSESACNHADTCDGAGNCDSNIEDPGALCSIGSEGDATCDSQDTCNSLGVCLENRVPDNTPCNDGFFCTDGETCDAGFCTNSTPHDCADSFTCTTDTCIENGFGTGSCVITLDANRCLIEAACYVEGGLNPDNSCEECDSTTPNDWTVLANGSSCNDGNACTGADICTGGNCAGTVDPDCNANCESSVTAVEGQNLSNNSSGGADDGEASCQNDSNSDVWWDYTALCDGLIFLSTTGSNLQPLNDPVLNVYTACPPDGGTGLEGEIACDDDSGLDLNAALIFPVLTGNTYLIRVAGFENNVGNVVLNLRPFDDCVIDGVCYSEDDLNPENKCQACIPDVSTTQWTNLVEGTLCDDDPDAEDTACDGPDTCDGLGVCEDNHKPDDTACLDEIPANVCTKNLCAGGNCTHPPEPSGLACGSPNNTDCDNPDTCNGGGLCVPNFEAPGFECGDNSVTECDNGDICDAIGNCLDNLDPNGTPCDDFDVCTDTEFCFNGVCIGVGIPDAPIVEGLGGRNLLVTPQPLPSPAPVALRLTSPTWTCLDLYIQEDGTLDITPFVQLPADWGTILVGGLEIYPSSGILPSIYEVVAECGVDMPPPGSYTSPPGSGATWRWGDIDHDNDVDFVDIELIVTEWRFMPIGQDPDPVFDTFGCPPDNRLNFRDIEFVVRAFKGQLYPCPEPCP